MANGMRHKGCRYYRLPWWLESAFASLMSLALLRPEGGRGGGRSAEQSGAYRAEREQNQKSKTGIYSNQRKMECAASAASALGLHG